MAGAIRLRPLLAESFTDPEAHAGTCYKASNWEPVGLSAGYSRHRADFHVSNERPKRRWLRPLDPDARRLLRAPAVPADCQAGCIAPPSGVRRSIHHNKCRLRHKGERMRFAPRHGCGRMTSVGVVRLFQTRSAVTAVQL